MTSRRQIAWDTGLSLALNVSARGAGTLVFILLSRVRGAPEAGTFTLAIGYLAILTTIFLGLDDILVRQVARQPERTWSGLVTYGALRGSLSVLAWTSLALILPRLPQYSSSDFFVIMVIAASILPDTLTSLGQAVLNAHQDFAWPLMAGVAGAAIKLTGTGVALLSDKGLELVAWAWPAGSIVAAVFVGFGLLRRQPSWLPFASSWSSTEFVRYIRLVPTFAGASLLSALEGQLDVILLSIMAPRIEVAEYAAAATLLMAMMVLSQAYRTVLYPQMVRSLAGSPRHVRQLLISSLLTMGFMALLLSIIISVLAPWLVEVIFQSRYLLTSTIVRVLIWSAVFYFVSVPLTRFLIAADGQGTVFRVLLISLAANLTANLVLIPTLGPVAPAWARLLSSSVFAVLAGAHVFRVLRRPVTLSTA